MELNKLYRGDCLDIIKTLPENSIDSIITDPPYELGFMGKSWDNTGIANNKELWKECLRVLKPGGHLLAFSGTRTYHRMACAIEDAGFEVRDMIEWVYGSGFPKSLNIGKAINKIDGVEFESKPAQGVGFMNNDIEDGYHPTINQLVQKGDSSERAKQWEGWGTALKPAHEPICMARKPLAEKTVAENCLKYGTGGINIDESRVATEDKMSYSSSEKQGVTQFGTGTTEQSPLGRFPANLIHDNSEEVRECFPETNGGKARTGKKGGSGFGFFDDEKTKNTEGTWHGGSGNASRFFKSIPIEEQDEIQEECTDMEEKLEKLDFLPEAAKSIIYNAKASKSERNKGCEELEEKVSGHNTAMRCSICNKWTVGTGHCECPREERQEIWTTNKNNHPTVKPIALMEYLIKMMTREGQIVLDPFGGSGTTGVACKNTNRNYILIEKDEGYCDIIEKRLSHPILPVEPYYIGKISVRDAKKLPEIAHGMIIEDGVEVGSIDDYFSKKQ